MSSARTMLELSSFRDAVARVLSQAADHGSVFRNSLVEPMPPNSTDTPTEEWRLTLSAYRLLWEIASREGAAEVMADVRTAFPEMAADVLDRLEGLLATDDVTQQRVRGVRRRDQFLPILTEARFSVDVRLVTEDDDADAVLLAPIVTVRLEFDEQLFGADGIVFQVPLTQLGVLDDGLVRVRAQLDGLAGTIRSSAVPDWALEGFRS